MDFSIEFYVSDTGRKVVEEELDAIARQAPVLHALLLAGLAKLKRRDHHRPPLCKQVDEDIYELRVGRRDIARALWFYFRGRRLVVVRCFVKKSQKIPGREQHLARVRMKDYLARHPDLT